MQQHTSTIYWRPDDIQVYGLHKYVIVVDRGKLFARLLLGGGLDISPLEPGDRVYPFPVEGHK